MSEEHVHERAEKVKTTYIHRGYLSELTGFLKGKKNNCFSLTEFIMEMNYWSQQEKLHCELSIFHPPVSSQLTTS